MQPAPSDCYHPGPWLRVASHWHGVSLRHSDPSIRHSGESRNPEGWGEGIVALGLVPSLGRTARSRTLHRPASHHFHPLMRPSQGHGDSRESRNPGVVYRLQMTRKHLHQSTPRFSYLGAPAATGMGDWYKSMSRTPIRDGWFPPRPLESPRTRHSGPPIRHSREGGNPEGRCGLWQ